MPWCILRSHRRRVLLVLCLVALAAGVLGWRLGASEPTEAAGISPDIALHGAGPTCTTDNPTVSGKCTAEVGAIFTVSVDVLSFAGLADLDGDTLIGYGGVQARVTSSSELPIVDRPGTNEVVGSECGPTAQNTDDLPNSTLLGCAGIEMTFLGTIFEVDITCTGIGTEEFRLVHQAGAGSALYDEGYNEVLDKDPSPEVLTFNCVAAVGTPAPTLPPAPPVKAVDLEAGTATTCARTASGAVSCWGRSFGGSSPRDVASLNGAAAVSAGFGHVCIVTSTGGVRCRGLNDSGQVGDGTTVSRPEAVDVVGLGTNALAVSAGGHHTCALTAAGGVKCWGQNGSGQLGDGTNIDRTTPVDVVGLTSGVVQVSAGFFHTCAALAAGGAKCWGLNGGGSLGDGTYDNRSAPVDVVGLMGSVDDISAGAHRTCAVTGGSAMCWGEGLSIPGAVSGLEGGVVGIEAGGQHSCALMESGTVRCWGSNDSGELGNGTTADSSLPVGTTGLAGQVSLLSAGDGHNCALIVGGQVQCWGANIDGQLGAPSGECNGSYDCSAVPVSVPGFGQPLEPPPTPTPTPTPTPEFPFNLKLPALKNLFLMAQGAKLPPSTCAASTDSAVFAHEIGYAPNTPDPKDPSRTQQVGGFEMDVLFDEDLVCVNLAAGAYFAGTTGSVCFIDDKDQGLQPDGLARIGCVVKGSRLR